MFFCRAAVVKVPDQCSGRCKRQLTGVFSSNCNEAGSLDAHRIGTTSEAAAASRNSAKSMALPLCSMPQQELQALKPEVLLHVAKQLTVPLKGLVSTIEL